ncbi:MAG: glycosyltransferase [Armatimonadetes bacterium]|nr:glycosyltransferase [Armatimonadota bacterium]
MRILYLSHILPVSEMTGDLRHYRFLKGLARKNLVRLLVCTSQVTWTSEDIRRLEDFVDSIEVIQLKPPCASKVTRFANRMLWSLSFNVEPWWLDYDFEKALIRSIENFQPDIIHANMPTARHCFRIKGIPVVVDICDAVSLQSPLHGGWLRSWWWLKGYREMEAFIGSFADRVLVISERDAAAINCPREKIAVVPNGVDLEYYQQCEKMYDRHMVCFVGAMDYIPNVDAAVYFANKVWPLVREVSPAAKAYIVGKNPLPEVQKLNNQDGVVVTGTVDDVRPYIWRCATTVAPLRFASGMQNKVLQSLAMGVPVVMTPAANGGIGACEENGVIVASDPSGMAEAIVCLMRDSDRRKTLGMLGRHYVEKNFTWERSIDSLEEVYHEVLGNRAAMVA